MKRSPARALMRIGPAALGALLLAAAACDEYYDIPGYSFIDTVLVADSISNNGVAPVVVYYPAGCNSFDRIEMTADGDTLELAALYSFYYRGEPCVHGAGFDTVACRLLFSRTGRQYLEYRRNEETRVLQLVFVTE